MEASQCDLGIASEGSFGPLPPLFFVPSDEELVIFIDKKNGLEVIAREVSTDTNFSAEKPESLEALEAFAEKVGFPSHGLILRDRKSDNETIIKGITSPDLLRQSFERLIALNGHVYAETDMRALYNPRRMKVIERATEKLMDRIQSCCPKCMTPGFIINEIIPGLPCELCSSPTKSPLIAVFSCSRCGYRNENKYPLGKEKEDATYCDYCNP